MTAAPAITPDAAGITEASRQRTGTVVDRLLAPDAAATADSIVHIPLRLIVAHPNNRKILDDDVADLVAEFKAGMPVINPLGVTAAADWNTGKPDELKEISPAEFIITAGGHRRLRAAELAGLDTVPCIIRSTFAGVDGRRAALLENLHRQDLDAFQEAAAFAELIEPPYKISQRDLAKVVGCNQSHISKRLKLLKLPSTIREKVRVGTLKIQDAVDLAAAADNEAVFNEALERVTTWGWPGKQAVERAQDDFDEEQAYAATVAKAVTAGLTVIDRSPAWGVYSRTEPVRLEATGITKAKHKSEPCHAVHVDRHGELDACCAEPARHLPDGESKHKLSDEARDTLERWQSRGRGSSMSDAEQRKQRRELKKTYPARMMIAGNLVRGMHSLTDATVGEFTRRGLIGAAFHSYNGRKETWLIVRELTGTVAGDYPQTAETDKLAMRPADWLTVAFATAYFEGQIRANNIRWSVDQRYYLDLLTGLGYEISDVEHQLLGDKRSMAGAWVPPSAEEQVAAAREDEAPPCRVCGKHAEDLEPGVTWVDEDLCSACSDAAEAGWLDDETAAG